MNQPTLKERLSYWFDNRMAKGSLTLIHLLLDITIVLVGFLSVAVWMSARSEFTFFQAFWDTLGTIINAWMPSSGDSDSIGYLIFMAIAAFCGLMITSVLIGIFASAIEEKIYSLRRGNSVVLEKGHYVVLGFYPGEYTLINQLILAAAGNPCTIVVAESMERDEMENNIRDNIAIPQNIRIICRTVDIFDPATLEKLSLHNCHTVIISPTDDKRTVKALLAVSTIINDTDNDVRVGAIISKEEYRFPPSIAVKHNVTTLQTNDTIAKIIAHSCTQAGLSDTFKEVFNFEGNELYCIQPVGVEGYTFEQLLYMMDGAVPAGIRTETGIQLNPPADTIMEENTGILVFAEDRNAARVLFNTPVPEIDPAIEKQQPAKKTVMLLSSAAVQF